MEEKTNTWKISFFILLVIVFGVGIGALAYTLGKRTVLLRERPAVSTESATIPEQEETVSTTTPIPTTDEIEAIKQTVYAKTGLNKEEAEVTISLNTGTHAKGLIREYGTVSGAYWIAAKSGGNWVGVYSGQAHPTCAEIDPYNFPTDMVPQCMDQSMNVVDR